MKNSEAILVTPKQFEIQECAVPEPKDHEILMKLNMLECVDLIFTDSSLDHSSHLKILTRKSVLDMK